MALEELLDVGLTEGEAKVYLALLELGGATNGQLARRTGLQSSSVYYCLNALTEKGFASSVVVGKARVFRAADPRELTDVMERQREKFEESAQRLENSIPDLMRRQQKAEKQYALAYEGEGGMRAAFNEFLRSQKKGDLYYSTNLDESYATNEAAQQHFRAYHLRRSKKGVRVRLLANPTVLSTARKIMQGLKHFEVRTTTETMPVGILVSNDRTLEHVWEDKPTAFMIHSRIVAERHTKYCEKLWAKAKFAFKG